MSIGSSGFNAHSFNPDLHLAFCFVLSAKKLTRRIRLQRNIKLTHVEVNVNWVFSGETSLTTNA
jgi:hypothetical protein